MTRRRRWWRRIERAIVGTGMTMVAFVLERRVLKAIKRRGEEPPADVPGFRDAEVRPSTGES